jgi:hypothetical protein
MPPKKKQKINTERQQRDHPIVEQWKAVATLASNITKYVQQQQQYIALLRQIAQLTEHEAANPENPWFSPNFIYDDEKAKEIEQYIEEWLGDIIDHHKSVKNSQSNALGTLRKVDILDDEALKQAALTLTESETHITALEMIIHKWQKIVRFKNGPDIQKHTQSWIKRWLSQWKKIDDILKKRVTQFLEVLKVPLIHETLDMAKDLT